MDIRIGLIGYGSMGSMLAKGMLNNGIVPPRNFFIATRSQAKIDRINAQYPEVQIGSIAEAAKYADVLFVCVKPLDVKDILREIKAYIREDCHLITIAGGVTIANIEKILPRCKITKLIPSLTSEVNEGVSLVCNNVHVGEEDTANVQQLLQAFSLVKTIHETDFEIATDLTSCMPGFIAAIFSEFVEASLKHGTLTREESTEMVVKTLYGTAKLLSGSNMGFAETLARVATKGGITEEGATVLQRMLPEVFDAAIVATLAKNEAVKGRMDELFNR